MRDMLSNTSWAGRLAFWTLLPFVIPQALWVRRTAPRFADAAGPAHGAVGHGAERRLLAVGDSIIAGVGAATLTEALVGQTAAALADKAGCRVTWRALGRTGATSSSLLERLAEILPAATFDDIIVSIGVNDVTRIETRQRFARQLERILDLLHTRYPGARIAFAGLPPLGIFPLLPQPLRAVLGLRADTLDRVLEEVLQKSAGTVHVPVEFEFRAEAFSDDGFHPSAASYAEFGASMAEALLCCESPATGS
ncbi:MAG: SGNH/GDSL hydrolase family protein [Pseudomonadota bacterium]